MSRTYEIIRGTVILTLFLAGIIWFLVRWLKKSQDDPGQLISKWIITALSAAFVLAAALWAGPVAPILVVPVGIVMAYVWAPNLGSWLISPLTNAIDGGGEAAAPRPFYSIAQSHRMHSRYAEAVAEVERQLAKFPNDFQGQMLLAAIQAENLGDLRAAEVTLEGLLAQPGHTPGQLSGVLYTLADWHLKYAQSREAARKDLLRVQRLFPATEFAIMAGQRLSNLGDDGLPPLGEERAPIEVKTLAKDGGLVLGQIAPPPPEEDPPALAAKYVRQLQAHPNDWETREKLAIIYMEHYKRLDMAVTELEHLIAIPHQPARQVVRWLNMIAEFQITQAGELEKGRATLQRIVTQYPNTAAAIQAQNRLVHLGGEQREKRKSQGFTLGSYDKDIGLKS